MALVERTIPNLIGGVSQQASSARSETASEYELNTYHSLVSGNVKRPPAQYVSEVYNTSEESADGVAHGFKTSDGREWLLMIDSDSEATGRLAVVDVLSGDVQEIDISGDGGYISGVTENYHKTFRFLSVGDTTFICNRTVAPVAVPVPESDDPNYVVPDFDVADFESLPDPQVAALGSIGKVNDQYYTAARVGRYESYFQEVLLNTWRPFTPVTDRSRKDPKRTASVYIRQAVHDTTYSFTITFEDDTTASASYTTPDPVNGSGNPVPINTDMVVNGLVSAFSSGAATASRKGSTLSIAATKDIRKIDYSDSFGDQASRAYADSVQQFNDLPPNEVEGRVVRINGAIETGGDDYFVEYRDGVWTETVGFGERSTLDDSTMPHTLVYEPVTSSFVLTTHEWPGRTSGDKVSNPDPTFVNKVINDLLLFKGRMTLLADENVIFSEVGYYENFYRTTLTQLIETDPIDVAATTSQTSILYHGVSFDETLVVFSDEQQFRILSGDSLTPLNISIAPTTAYEVSIACDPVAVGSNVMFVEDGETSRYASLREYYRNPNTENDDAADITGAVPKYIPSGVKQLKAATNENVVICLTENNGGELYVYKYYWSGGEKVVSSWTKWKLENCRDIVSVEFFGDVLYALVRDIESQVHLVKIDIEEGKTDENQDYMTLLDMRVKSTNILRSYDPTFDLTRFRLPMRVPEGVQAQCIVTETTGDFPEGYELPVVAVDGRFIFVEGNAVDLPMWIGFKYQSIYRFSDIYVRGGRDGNTIAQNRRLALRYMTLYFDDTSAFKVEVTPKGRQTWTGYYSGRRFSDASSVTDNLFLDDGHYRFSCKGRSDAVQIDIINETPFPSAFNSAIWEGEYNPQARRI